MSAPFPFFHVRVAAVRDLSPSMRRLTFTGPTLDDWADTGWDQRIKLVLPAPDGGYAHLPASGPDWYRQWLSLPEPQRPPIRTYTTRAVRPAGQGLTGDGTATEVDVDMVVHTGPDGPEGPAARWIEAAGLGTGAVLLGPSRSWLATQEPGAHLRGGIDFVPPAVTERFLLGGDETAAPAIARILQDLPREARGVAVVEMPRAADAAYLPAHPGFEVRVLGREGAAHGSLLVEGVARAVAEMCPVGRPHEVEEIGLDELLWEVPRHAKGGAALSRTSLYAWLAGEASAVRAMRRHLVAERGLDRRTVAFMGYWRLGRAEG
ncbi:MULTISPECIES: siderophore-interacting protein [unclassified Actinomyces]|uniref:siderophore-interacting protein n=3 Tax=Actinomyces TaxID=1654 RepID=UPI0020170130|nr:MULTISPECIES: siderophore-interacting protein [unclassified Actinomyces]MCL3778305.1 siderophore-interacting protein [Actinomyces sp. AC-20-1]MCL3788767.1 siderophore-interacting protein [Actinomyces sp. 187325]MCL3791635.1 siderophore-interacting protein [Actinomyces sp. 186855]MCL3794298.1 siderophore-interacting protein [Actinomyces sp. 217892]